MYCRVYAVYCTVEYMLYIVLCRVYAVYCTVEYMLYIVLCRVHGEGHKLVGCKCTVHRCPMMVWGTIEPRVAQQTPPPYQRYQLSIRKSFA